MVNNLSYPWLPVCDGQLGSSSALASDCVLALINLISFEEKEDGLSIFKSLGPDSCSFYAFCHHWAATNKIGGRKKTKKNDEDSRRWFHVIPGCSVLASFFKFEVLGSADILFSYVFMVYMNIFRWGGYWWLVRIAN